MPSDSKVHRDVAHESSKFTITRALVDAVIGKPLKSLSAQEFENTLDRAYELALFPLFYELGRAAGHESHDAYRAGIQRQRWIAHRMRGAMLRESLMRISGALDGFNYLILKGAPLSERIYDSPYWRDSGDIDVLIRYEEIEEAIRRLAAIGFMPDPDQVPQPWVNNEYCLTSKDLGVVIELHWSLALPRVPSPTSAHLLDGRQWHRTSSGVSLPVLEIEAGFLQACYHFHHHTGFLKGLFDIAGWLDRYGDSLDMDQIDALSSSLGITGIVQWPLHILRRVTNLQIPGLSQKISLFVAAWSRFSSATLTNALSTARPIAGDHALAFKTQNILKGQIMLWSGASMTLLDTPSARVGGLLSPIFLGPNAMAAKYGKSKPDLEIWARITLRPVELVIKQLRDIRA